MEDGIKRRAYTKERKKKTFSRNKIDFFFMFEQILYKSG